MIHFPYPFVVVKVHAAGVPWWEEQGMPPTLTIGCRTLEQDKRWKRRPYVGDTEGRHYVYWAPGLEYQTWECDTYVETYTNFSRVPPDKSKYWIDQRDPADIDWFPDLTPMRQLALDNKPTIGTADQ